MPNEQGPGEGAPTLGDLERYTGELREKAEAARRRQRDDLRRKVSDRESLIVEVQKTDELLATAREAIDYYHSIQKQGELRDVKDVRKLAELQTLVESLEKQRKDLAGQITSISTLPEVLGELHEAARKEDVERAVESISDRVHEELDPQIDALAQAIAVAANDLCGLEDAVEAQERLVTTTWDGGIGEAFARARATLGQTSHFGPILDRIFEESKIPQDLIKKLTDAGSSLGVFKRKEKAAIDLILSQTSAFAESEKQLGALSSLRHELNTERQTRSEEITARFKEIIAKAWTAQGEINKLTGAAHASDLPAELGYRLEKHLKHVAGAGSGGWYRATQDRKGRIIYDTLEELRRSVSLYSSTDPSGGDK